jgi:uncharacterized protein YecE (DUF72 family)
VTPVCSDQRKLTRRRREQSATQDDSGGMTPPSSAPAIWIGTSGWTYDGWRGPFYPQKLPKKDWLHFYASRFATAEINGSFYRTPSLDAVKAWREQTPPGFLFAWKASKFITHWKRLTASCENSIALMDTRLRVLAPKVGVVLFQLPHRFGKDSGRLRDFLRMLPRRYRYAFEFRDEAWYAPDVFDVLQASNVALCISDHADAPAPWEVTARHVYVRGHGPSGRYHGSYSDRTLRHWAERVLRWQAEGREVFVYFDNDQKAAAPRDALRLVAELERVLAASVAATARQFPPASGNRLSGQRLPEWSSESWSLHDRPMAVRKSDQAQNDIGEERAMAKRRRKYSPSSGREVESEMRRYKRGTARSGKGGRGGKVKSRKQAVAIGLSKARKKGKKVPPRKRA